MLAGLANVSIISDRHHQFAKAAPPKKDQLVAVTGQICAISADAVPTRQREQGADRCFAQSSITKPASELMMSGVGRVAVCKVEVKDGKLIIDAHKVALTTTKSV